MIFAKNNKYLVFIIVLFLILISSSLVYAGYTISGFGIEYNNVPINAISLNYPININTVFHINNNSFLYIQADLSEIVKNPIYSNQYRNLAVGLNDCVWENSSQDWKCKINNIRVNPATATINLSFKITNTTNTTNQTLIHTFNIDNDAPSLESITTNYCYEDMCYIKSGTSKVNLEFSDSNEQFARKMVFFEFDNNKFPVNNCSNGACSGYANKVCVSGQSFILSLATTGNFKTEDDAGNPIASNLTQQIICDSIPPYQNMLGYEESNITFVSNSDYGLIKGGESLDIKAYVYEDGPLLVAKANLSSIGGDNEEVTCTKDESVENLFICDFSVSHLLNEHMQKDLEFEFFDIVNNSWEKTKEITILKGEGDGVNTPKCLKANEGEFYPKKINRVALGLAQMDTLVYPIYAPYVIERKGGSSCRNFQLNEQVIDDCWIETPGQGTIPAFGNIFDTASDIEFPYAIIGERNFIDLPITQQPPNTFDNFDLICNLSLYVSDDEKVYSNPQKVQVSWDVELMNSALGTPGVEYTKRIKDGEDLLNNGFQKTIGFLNDAGATMSKLCSVRNTLIDIGWGVGLSLDITQYVYTQFNQQAKNDPKWSQPVQVTADKFAGSSIEDSEEYQEAENTVKDTLTDAISTVLEVSCQLSYCSLETNDNEDNKYDFMSNLGDVADVTGFSDITENINRPNLYNSVIQCFAKQCWPGVIYHFNRYREAECQRIYCLKRQAQYGLSVESCDVAKKTFLCKFIVGEIFELPGIRVAKNIVDNFNHFAQNLIPQSIVNLAKMPSCTTYYKQVLVRDDVVIDASKLNLFDIITCEIPMVLGEMIKSKRLTSSAGDFVYPQSGVDICKLALCNEEDESNCDVRAGWSWLNQRIGDDVSNIISSEYETADERLERMQRANRLMGNGENFAYDIDAAFKTTGKDREKAIERLGYYGLDLDPTKYENNNNNNLKEDLIQAYRNTVAGIPESETTVPPGWTAPAGTATSLSEKALKDLKQSENEITAWERLTNPETPEFLQDDSSSTMEEIINIGRSNGEKLIGMQQMINKDTTNRKLYEMNEKQLVDYLKKSGFTDDMNKKISDKDKISYKYRGETITESFKDIADNCKEVLNEKCRAALKKIKSMKEEAREQNINKQKQENKKQRQKQEAYENNLEKLKDFRALRDKTRKILKWALRLVWDKYIKDLGTLESLGGTAADVSDWLNTYLNSESWKASICNPVNSGFSDYDVPEGDAIDCTGPSCQTILTMAIERAPYNWSDEQKTNVDNYIYSLVYKLGPVKTEYNYNIYFEYQNGKKYWVSKNTETKEREDININPDEGDSTSSLTKSFISPQKYDKMCFWFDKKFPSNEIGSKTEYCRKIVANAFNTGEPDRNYNSTNPNTGNDENDNAEMNWG